MVKAAVCQGGWLPVPIGTQLVTASAGNYLKQACCNCPRIGFPLGVILLKAPVGVYLYSSQYKACAQLSGVLMNMGLLQTVSWEFL